MDFQVRWKPLLSEYLIKRLHGNWAPECLKIQAQITEILSCLKKQVIFCFRIWKSGMSGYFSLHVFKICLINLKPEKL